MLVYSSIATNHSIQKIRLFDEARFSRKTLFFTIGTEYFVTRSFLSL